MRLVFQQGRGIFVCTARPERRVTLENYHTEFLILIVAMFLALSVLLVVSIKKQQNRAKPIELLADKTDQTVFLFAEKKLVDATPSALQFLDTVPDRTAIWDRLVAKVSKLCPDSVESFQALAHSGLPFCLHGDNTADPLTVLGKPEGGLVRISLKREPAPPEETIVRTDTQNAMLDDLENLREIVDKSPLLAWRENQKNEIIWANRSYFETLEKVSATNSNHSWPLPSLFEPDQNLRLANSASHRKSLKIPDQNRVSWYEVFSFDTGKGSVLHFALLADPIVKAEEALRDFVQTLTQTFAHLPIGLAVFDRKRQLALFNPALADLTALKPEWLGQRPTLFGFLDQLRDNRHMPEPKDYPSWRRKMVALEQSAVSGTYEENWALPTGQTYKVTGRPHPQGAVAFLFEDISSSILLQRQFKSEIVLGQSVIDSLPEAIAVFSLGGYLALSNTAYSKLWGTDPATTVGTVDIVEATRIWQTKCRPTPVWGDLRDYVIRAQERSEWLAKVVMIDGTALQARFNPLSDGAILCVFLPENQPEPAEIAVNDQAESPPLERVP